MVSILAVSETSASAGTGFFISAQGHILTNSHVIRTGEIFIVQTLDGTIYRQVSLIGVDPMTDLAVLKIQPPGPFKVLSFADSNLVRPGQTVCAIGHGNAHRNSFTMGVVSARRSQLPRYMTEGMGLSYMDLIQSDVSTNHGNSGGPLLDLAGKCVGINTAIDINTSTGDDSWQGISFAIAGNLAKMVADRIIRDGHVERVRFGIDGQNLTPDLSQAFKVPATLQGQGILVSHIDQNSPAETAGLRAGDILLSLGITPLDAIQRIRIEASFFPPGKPVSVKIFRQGKIEKIAITPQVDEIVEPITIQRMGIKVDALARKPADLPGLLIEHIEINSPFYFIDIFSENKGAGGSGIDSGEQILEFNHGIIKTAKDLQRAVKLVKPGELILMLIKGENGEFRYVAGKLP